LPRSSNRFFNCLSRSPESSENIDSIDNEVRIAIKGSSEKRLAALFSLTPKEGQRKAGLLVLCGTYALRKGLSFAAATGLHTTNLKLHPSMAIKLVAPTSTEHYWTAISCHRKWLCHQRVGRERSEGYIGQRATLGMVAVSAAWAKLSDRRPQWGTHSFSY
jgi:hypothetical protein